METRYHAWASKAILGYYWTEGGAPAARERRNKKNAMVQTDKCLILKHFQVPDRQARSRRGVVTKVKTLTAVQCSMQVEGQA